MSIGNGEAMSAHSGLAVNGKGLVKLDSEAPLRPPYSRYPAAAPDVTEGIGQILWRSRRLVLCTALWALLIAVAYLAIATPIYYAGAKLYVEQRGPRIISTDSTQFLTDSKNYLYLQQSLLKSTPVVLGVLEMPGVKELKSLAGIDDRLGYLKDQINVDVGRKDEILTVWMELPYPEDSARLVNALVESYTRFNSAQKQVTGAEVLKILQQEKRLREEELTQKIQAMLAFKQANPSLSFTDEKGNILTQKLSRLSAELTAAQVEAMVAKANFDVVEGALKDPDPARRKDLVESLRAKGEMSAIDRDTEGMRKELAQYETRLPILVTQYGENHPVVRGSRAYMAELKSRLAAAEWRVAEAYLASVRQTLETSRSKETVLRRSFEEQRQASLELNSQEVEFARLQTDQKQVEKYCELLNERIKELTTVENAPALHIRVLETAQAAAGPSSPNAARTLAMALALGLAGGAGWSLVRHNTDKRLRTPGQTAHALNVRVLGTIPHISSCKTMGITTGSEALSEAAEAYRSLRTILYHGVEPEKSRTILITSPGPSEGKSTVACGLAMAMWQSGEKVLVLDADLRRPTIHRLLGITVGVGLTNVLTDNIPLEGAIKPTSVPGLDVLPCGTIPPNPAEILHSRAFAELLEELTRRYHRIVLDSPPTNLLADARIISGLADLTLLVIRSGRTMRGDAINAVESLASVGARMFGVIANDLRSEYNGYYYQGKNSGKSRRGGTQQVVGDPSKLRFLNARVLPQEGERQSS